MIFFVLSTRHGVVGRVVGEVEGDDGADVCILRRRRDSHLKHNYEEEAVAQHLAIADHY